MQVFNVFYYSFSPRVASYINSHGNLRPVMKIVLYPLIGILYASSQIFNAVPFNGELAITVAGTLASFAIGAIYLAPLLTILTRLRRSRSTYARQLRAVQVSIIAAFASLAGLLLAEIIQDTLLLEVTTSSTVLSCITLGGVVVSWSITRMWSRGR